MNCSDFERLWNECLDAPQGAAASLLPALQEHASSCSRCRPMSLKYERLRQAIRLLEPLPAAPAGTPDRVVARFRAEQSCRPGAPARWLKWSPYAAAALILIAGLISLRSGVGVGPTRSGRLRTAESGRPLAAALADATSATWDLAREASAPAARVGGQMLASAQVPDTRAELPLPLPAEGVLHEVTDRINAGMEPLSGSARHAFGFLFDPATRDRKKAEPEPTAPRPVSG